jgi:hypothetical protein
MTNDMGLTPTDFDGLPGAPLTQAEIDAAVAAVRTAAGWHIAPERDETLTLDVDCWERTLRLPTKQLASVDEVRDTKLSTVIAATTYEVSVAKGAVRKCGGVWPHGYGRLEVDLTHGYATVPADLLPVFAETVVLSRRDQTADSLTAGPFGVTYSGQDVASRTVNPLSTASVLERYSLFQMGAA